MYSNVGAAPARGKSHVRAAGPKRVGVHVGDSRWNDASRKAIEWSFQNGGMAFCTDCGAKLRIRRSGASPGAEWVLKCPLCERELRFPVDGRQSPGA